MKSPLDPGGPFAIRTIKYCNLSLSESNETKQFTCFGGSMRGLQGPILSSGGPSSSEAREGVKEVKFPPPLSVLVAHFRFELLTIATFHCNNSMKKVDMLWRAHVRCTGVNFRPQWPSLGSRGPSLGPTWPPQK